MKHNLKIIGNFFGTDGYTSHTKNLFNALASRNDTNMKIETQLIPNWEKVVNDNELNAITKEDDGNFDNIIITMPHQWKLFTGLNKNYAFVIWEGDKVPLSWIDEFINDKIDYIFVPSEHTKQAIYQTIYDIKDAPLITDKLDDKIHIIPHGVDHKLFYSQRKKDKDDGSNVSLSGDTKQIQGKNSKDEQMPVYGSNLKDEPVDNHVDTMSQDSSNGTSGVPNEGSSIVINTHSDSSPNSQQVKLINVLPLVDKDALTNPAKNVVAASRIDGRRFTFVCNKGWRGTNWDRGGVQYLIKAFSEEFTKDENVQLLLKLNPAYINPQILQQAMQTMNLPKDCPPININLDNMPFDKLVHFYHQGDCFVCPTRAESFNLPGLEAMSCGLPTIQTSNGGQCDYMNDKNSLFIDYELNLSEELPTYEGISWATPKIESIRKQMRWVFNNQDKIKEMGKQAEIDSKQWSWTASAKKIVEILKK